MPAMQPLPIWRRSLELGPNHGPLTTRTFEVFISTAYAQAAPAPAGGSTESTLFTMLPLVLMFVVLYFIMIRPQMKRQKEHKALIEALAKGDEVVTAGGMAGKVSKLGETYIGIEVAANVEVQVQRSAVVQVLPKGSLK
jgi:preprotein translocase subunit YajC